MENNLKKDIYIYIYTHLRAPLLDPVWLFWDPKDCSLPGSSVYKISQVRRLEWVAISFSRGFPRPRNWTHISCIGKQILYHWATWEIPSKYIWITESFAIHMELTQLCKLTILQLKLLKKVHINNMHDIIHLHQWQNK